MSYSVRIKREAQRKLQRLALNDRTRITERIAMLGADPDDTALDTKQLAGSRLWRLRVGRWRVLYDRQDNIRVLSIERIGPRGDVYK